MSADPSRVQTPHAQLKLGQLLNVAPSVQPQTVTEQPAEPARQIERDPATGRIIRGVAQDTNKYGTAGRPTLYTPDLCADLIAYFDIEPNREVMVVQHFGKDSSTETPKELPNDLPTLEGWCKKTGIHPSTVSEWAKQYPDFSEAITRAKAMQYHILVVNGLKGLYDARFAIFVATNITNLKSKSITEENGEKKIIVEHRDYVNERRIYEAETVDGSGTLHVRA